MGLVGAPHLCSLGAAPCYLLFMLTCAILMPLLIHRFATVAQTTFGHSGWQLPLLPGNQTHDYHHSTVDAEEGPQNLGVIGCLDHMLGTDRAYLRSWQALLNFQYTNPDYAVDKTLSLAPSQLGLAKQKEAASMEGPAAVPQTVIAC